MTHPPTGPAGRPGPYGPPGGQYPQGPQYGQAPQQSGPPPQQFDAWKPAPAGSPSLEGPVGEPPKKRRTGLVAGIVAAVVVVVAGGVTALVLLTGNDGGGSSAAAPGAATPSSSAQTAPGASPAALAQAAVDSLNDRSASQYATLVCSAPDQADLANLQQQWTSATDLHGSVTGSPQVSGTTATVEVTVTYNGQTQSSKIPMKQQGQKWCIDES
ncbi:hypothetical protein FHX82_004055 [Amycolatopsis bartoniae]|uniref:DUF4878 domain-containing protein n=1 Tax=Amycolatopsis bartoniae TaxID=941986 RepID=A0A8H9IU26_9PSEU|nr:hypothetical protein [Amycolatopsis bartoniae]MBB2936991.1 hypothetical protein [Amycolatopsis bartoniae]TVT06426.1 hypothetical protein FNH07_20090 [Amycolatopsis bartoniae]GHF51674.1 hypothetical protein GCM10017566_26110 [Amycolatopsis bartoniae]